MHLNTVKLFHIPFQYRTPVGVELFKPDLLCFLDKRAFFFFLFLCHEKLKRVAEQDNSKQLVEECLSFMSFKSIHRKTCQC